jgi:protein arginine N-methyltransferase 1
MKWHRKMVGDRVRTTAYQKAIYETVKKGDIVLDLGTGTGIMALFACHAGARRVYAIEANDVIEVARRVCRENGFLDTVQFIHDLSTKVTLPEKVDVIISELLGYLALEENGLPYVIDARKRVMKDNGILIPSSVEIFMVPVEAPDVYAEVEFWDNDLYGIDFSSIREMAINDEYILFVDHKGFLCDPLMIRNIDLYTLDEILLDSSISFVMTRTGTFHGLVGWFDAQLSKGVRLSTSPKSPPTHWKNIFFPSDRPVPVVEGDTIEVSIRAVTWDEDIYWNWEIEIFHGSGTEKDFKKAKSSHSTFRSFPLTKESIRGSRLIVPPFTVNP